VQPKSGSEYTVWPVVHALLTQRGLDDVDAEEALRLQRAGKAVIVDCRPTYQVRFFSFFPFFSETSKKQRALSRALFSLPPPPLFTLHAPNKTPQFKNERIEGAISVPLYQEVQGKEVWDNVKRAVCAVGLAMVATERNPEFLKDAERALGGKNTLGPLPFLGSGKKIIVYCGVGGTLEVGVKPWSPERTKSFKDDPERMFGRESRSLKACYELGLVGGFKGVTHLRGGLSQWRHDGFPVE
jgi:rhodanese-related sulfurtransferase